MTSDEFCKKNHEHMCAETLEDWDQAKALLMFASQNFTDPEERETISNISSQLMESLGYLLATREGTFVRDENDDYVDDDDVILCGPSTDGKVEYISG
jgi:hypothetical protein